MSYLKLNDIDVDLNEVQGFVEKEPLPLHKIQIQLQGAPIKKAGVNGMQIDDVIGVVTDIIKAFNTNFPCRDNSIVITKLEEAQMWLEKRTKDRTSRGVDSYWSTTTCSGRNKSSLISSCNRLGCSTWSLVH